MANLEDIGNNFKEFNTLNEKGIPNIIQNWGNELIAQMRNNLTKNKSNASSNLLQSMIGKVTTPPTGYHLGVSMEDYWFYVENGRKPTQAGGDGQLYKNIYEWIQNKADIQSKIISKSPDRIAATKSLAYVITRKIHREGTTARPFASPALKQVTTQTLATRISEYIVDSLTGD